MPQGLPRVASVLTWNNKFVKAFSEVLFHFVSLFFLFLPSCRLVVWLRLTLQIAAGLITVVEASKHAAGDAADVPPAAPWRSERIERMRMALESSEHRHFKCCNMLLQSQFQSATICYNLLRLYFKNLQDVSTISMYHIDLHTDLEYLNHVVTTSTTCRITPSIALLIES